MIILTIVGARPQIIKAAALSRVISNNFQNIEEIIVHTGQHYDKNMSDVFFKELDINEPDFNLGVGSGSHAIQTSSMMVGIHKIIVKELPDYVLLYGDTNSTLAGSIVCSKYSDIRVGHIEAGLRSYNRKMPEEINRIITDEISDIYFTTESSGTNNLLKEGRKILILTERLSEINWFYEHLGYQY